MVCRFRRNRCSFGVYAALLLVAGAALSAQTVDKLQRERVRQMLTSIRNELKKTYFDPAFRGIDPDVHFERAAQRIDGATSLGQALGIVAQALVDFNDSHTVFIPPSLGVTVEYGWQVQMIGDTCYVVAVKPGSDAEKRGLKPGDRVVSIDGFTPSRSELWKLLYLYYALRPRSAVSLVVQSPDGETRRVDAASKVSKGKRLLDLTDPNGLDLDTLVRDAERETQGRRHISYRAGKTVIWKMPTFDFDPDDVDRVFDDMTKDADAVVLDLRGNPGGLVKTLERFTGRFFDHDVTIAQLKGRKPMSPMVAKKHGRVFTGPLVVLVDSLSASSAELFARVVQLEHRGTVVGDRSSGAVMQAHTFQATVGIDTVVFYGATITDADVIMGDGASLEHRGVTPDVVVTPTGADLAAGRDPVLVQAAAKVGVALDAKKAASMFPIEWR